MASTDALEPEALPLRVQEVSDPPPQVKAASIAPPTLPKILFLDGLRGLAALLVVCQHSGEYLHDLDLGACAVDTFFVLSSFLLTLLFLQKSTRLREQHASRRQWGFYLLDYGTKRVLRVYPLFATVATLLWLLPTGYKRHYYLVQHPEAFHLAKVLTFSFPHRYFVFWTLPLEMAYYCWLPLLCLGYLKLGKWQWVPFVPLYPWIVYMGCVARRSSHSPLLPHFPTFLAGSLAAALYVKVDTWRHATGFAFSKWHERALRAVEGVTVAGILSVAFRRNSKAGQPIAPTMLFHWVHPDTNPGFPFISVPLTVVLVIELLVPSCLSRALEWNVLRYWGKISFSVYLLHSFVVFSNIYGKDPTLYYDRLFLRFGLLLVLCTTSYHLVEYPSHVLAQRITRMLMVQGAKSTTPASYRRVYRTNLRWWCTPRTTQSA